MADDPGRVRAAPPWLRNAASAMWRELASYLSTTWALARSPRRFANDWWSGARIAMNPIAMLATGATLVTAARQLAGAALEISRPDSLMDTVATALGPYLHYVFLGVLCHAVLVAFIPDRQVRLADTIALALYVGAGPGSIAEIIGWATICALVPVGVTGLMLGIMLGTTFAVFCTVLASAFSGLHQARAARVVLAFAIAFPVTGVVFGSFDPPGSYGLHWVLSFQDGFQLTLGM